MMKCACIFKNTVKYQINGVPTEEYVPKTLVKSAFANKMYIHKITLSFFVAKTSLYLQSLSIANIILQQWNNKMLNVDGQISLHIAVLTQLNCSST